MLPTTAEELRRIIGERTHMRRRRLGIRSARRLSAQIGWGANRVGQVERAEVDLYVTELYDLARALRISVDYLLGETKDDPKPSVILEQVWGSG